MEGFFLCFSGVRGVSGAFGRSGCRWGKCFSKMLGFSGFGIFGVSYFEILGFSDFGILGFSEFLIFRFGDFRMLGFSDFREC